MIGFIIGCVVAMCCYIAGKEADKHIDYTDSDE